MRITSIVVNRNQVVARFPATHELMQSDTVTPPGWFWRQAITDAYLSSCAVIDDNLDPAELTHPWHTNAVLPICDRIANGRNLQYVLERRMEAKRNKVYSHLHLPDSGDLLPPGLHWLRPVPVNRMKIVTLGYREPSKAKKKR